MLKKPLTATTYLLTFCILLSCGQEAQISAVQPKYQALKLFPESKVFSGFQLTNQNNKPWSADEFKGNYSVLFFGYANCPDICPTTLLDMQKINNKLKTAAVTPPQFVFVSVDPDRDTVEVLNEYISYFNPEFTALTGDAANILSLTTQLGVAYRVAAHQQGDLIYEVDHASTLFVLNPEGERIGIFTAPHDINNISADLQLLLDNS